MRQVLVANIAEQSRSAVVQRGKSGFRAAYFSMHNDAPVLVVTIRQTNEGIVREHRDESREQFLLDFHTVVDVVRAKRALDRLNAEQGLFTDPTHTHYLCDRSLVVQGSEQLDAVHQFLAI